MPIQAPQWTDYLNCPVCCREFGAPPRSPISLGCGHTVCRQCLKHLHRKHCPFDQSVIQVESDELVVNTALLQLAGYTPPPQPYHPPCIQALPERDRQAYDLIVRCMEHLAVYLKYCGNANNSMAGSRLSRPMQRKLVTLLQCAITDEEGRGRAARAARSLGERTVTELILQHQNPQQLSANLWAAVRARGCQFLGPAMQEEVLKLVLLALEDGSALSRKVLVMFVVQRLEPHFPQASKTSIGHVVQLLYRASCFKVSKRECDSSLMQLKDEFRTYESLRREHDAQIVQIATEAGLRIAPDQWSALLYGDTAHKSHMQSIIDKLQTPQSFAQSVQELFIALQRTGDPAQLVVMSMHLDRLSSIDASPDAKSPSWQQLAEVMTSLKEVVSGLIQYLQQQATGRDSNHNQKYNALDRCTEPSICQPSSQTAASTPTHSKYKISMCRDAAARSFCPRGNACTFAHSEEELERFRGIPNINGNYQGTYGQSLPPLVPVSVNVPPGLPLPSQPMFQQGFPVPPQNHNPHMDSMNYNNTSIQPLPPIQGPLPDFSLESAHHIETIQQNNFPMIQGQAPMIPVEQQFYRHYRNVVPMQETPPTNVQYQGPIYSAAIIPGAATTPAFQCPNQNIAPAVNNIYIGGQQNQSANISPYPFDNPAPTDLLPDYHNLKNPMQAEMVLDSDWTPNVNLYIPYRMISNDVPRIRVRPQDMYNFDDMRNALLDIVVLPRNPIPHIAPTDEAMRFNVAGDRRAVGADRPSVVERHAAMNDRPGPAVAPDRHAAAAEISNRADDERLEEELQALERRFDTEYENAD